MKIAFDGVEEYFSGMFPEEESVWVVVKKDAFAYGIPHFHREEQECDESRKIKKMSQAQPVLESLLDLSGEVIPFFMDMAFKPDKHQGVSSRA
jgi:hypothetical protein